MSPDCWRESQPSRAAKQLATRAERALSHLLLKELQRAQPETADRAQLRETLAAAW